MYVMFYIYLKILNTETSINLSKLIYSLNTIPNYNSPGISVPDTMMYSGRTGEQASKKIK